MSRIINGTVGFAAITYRIRACAGDIGLYAIFLTTDEWLFAVEPPKLFSADRQPLPLQHIAVGSVVNISVDSENWMQAVQIVRFADDCPFDHAG